MEALDYGSNMADCACALENMMLMANALDLGRCWINQPKWLNESEAVNALFRKLGMANAKQLRKNIYRNKNLLTRYFRHGIL